MVIQKIKECIARLSAYDHLKELNQGYSSNSNFITQIKDLDKGYINQLTIYFADKQEISASDVDFTKRIFAQRWEAVSDTECDYTMMARPISKLWVDLAACVAEAFKVHYIAFLIPTVENFNDPNGRFRISPKPEKITSLFIGYDEKTIYNAQTVFIQFYDKGSFIYPAPIDTEPKPRALNIFEIIRLRAKNESIGFAGVLYKNYWELLQKHFFPLWQGDGKFPPVLNSLRELLSAFSTIKTDKELGQFKEKLYAWSVDLNQYNYRDVNYLYSQEIKVGDGEDYFSVLEILTDLIQEVDACEINKAIALQNWLNCIELKNELKNIVQTAEPGWANKIEFILTQLNTQGVSASVISLLTALYKERWQNIKGTPADYTRDHSERNLPWIRVAQILSEADYIKTNYYCFLMPTIRFGYEAVNHDPLSYYALDDYILSEDEEYLICLANLNEDRLFNFYIPKALTAVERDRIQYAKPCYQKLLPKKNLNEVYIKYDTVCAIRDFVDEVFSNEDYSNEDEMGKALHKFYNYIHSLPEDEKERLDAQRTEYCGRTYDFKFIMEEIRKEECFTAHLRLLLKLVVDYFPDVSFASERKVQATVQQSRLDLNRKMYYEYSSLTREQANSKLFTLLYSLLTHKFDYSCTTWVKINIGEFSNKIPKEIEPMFKLLNDYLRDEESADPRQVLYQIGINIVRKTLDEIKTSWRTWFVISANTKAFYESIKRETIFLSNTFYEPETFFSAYTNGPDFDPALRARYGTFIDYALKVYSTPNNPMLQKLLINLAFNSKFKDTEQLMMMDTKLGNHRNVSAECFSILYLTALLKRIMTISGLASSTQLSFFNRQQESFKDLKISVARLSYESIEDVLKSVAQSAAINLSAKTQLKVEKYLHTISESISYASTLPAELPRRTYYSRAG